jgi:hypothetical protein
MQLPPGFVLDTPSSGPVYGAPAKTDPLGDEAARTSITKGQIDIANAPLDRQSKELGIQSTQQNMSNQQFSQKRDLRQEFAGLPVAKNYATVIQKTASALSAPTGPQGDLAVLYAFATVMDPNSVVRESEQELAKSTASKFAQLQQQYNSYLNGSGLPPGVRAGLLETMRKNVKIVNSAYDQQREFYADLAKRNGMDPFEVVGPHTGSVLNGPEAQYITDNGGTPRRDGLPIAARLTPEQESQFFTILQSKGRGAADEYLRQNGLMMANPKQADEPYSPALDYSPADATVQRPVQEQIDEIRVSQGDGGLAAARRGAADGLFLGAADEIRAGATALGGALRGEGSVGDLYDRNLMAEQGYQSQLQEENPAAYIGGQVVGGILPGAVTFGATTPLGMARGGAAVGALYGFNSGEGGFENRAANAVSGGAAGAALGYALPKGVQAVQAFRGRGGKAAPDLVDPVTGELNQVMDNMRPSERVAAFRDAGIDTVTPGMAGGRSARVVEQGMNNLPGSAGLMEDVNSAVAGESRKAMEGVADKFGSARTLDEAGAELQRGGKEWMDRASRVDEKVYRAIPIKDTAPAANTSTVATLQQLTGRFQSNPDLASAMSDPKLAQYLNAMQKGLSWKDLKDFRSVIGEKIGEMRFGEGSSISDLRALYAGLSEDMRNTAASNGPRAIRAFERANTFHRNMETQIEGALTRILGKDGNLSTQRAAAAVQTMTQGGKAGGDLKTLAQIKAATVKSGAWDEIASTLIRLGGQPANSQGRAFQPDTFVRWYADMAEPARAMLFKPEQRKALDQFVAVSQQLAKVKGLHNNSNSAPVMFGGGAVLTAAGTILDPAVGGKLAALMAANWGTAKLWTNQKFVNLATGYVRAAASGSPHAVKSQIGRLQKLAATNPELREPLERLMAGVANDNFAPGVAASNPEEEQR